MSDSAPMPLVIVNEHSRRFPRTLKDAFKVSEGYRAAIELPENPMAEKVVDWICWGISLAALAWMAWAGLSLPSPW